MLAETLEQGQRLSDIALERLLPAASVEPTSIHQAMRHSVFAGGKRLRPILAMEAARAVAGSLPEGVEDLGAALEMLHTYSLIHDDLRRGKPTCHKVYGEALAILAGDALQTFAYEVLSKLKTSAEARVRIVYEIARATGTVNGMIGGQVMDLEAERTVPGSTTIKLIHESKTAALITASLVTGGIFAGATAEQEKALRTFGKCVGLAFQIIDDVLDVTQSSAQLGKTAGKDKASQKATYPALFGVDESLVQAESLIGRGEQALALLGERGETLKQLANFLVERKK